MTVVDVPGTTLGGFGAGLALVDSRHDRVAERRTDAAWLAASWGDPASRVMLVSRGRTLVVEENGQLRLLLVPPSAAPAGDRYLLGTDGPAHFAVGLAELPSGEDLLLGAAGAVRPATIRQVGTVLDRRDAGLLVQAVALDNWHRSHRFCARCGRSTDQMAAGHLRHCDHCGTDHYPRTDPVVIMAVVDAEDRLLLARQASWPERRYSILAGFVEPGESVEQAVAREVAEEVGLRIRETVYRASQPWPFPSSLMLGFRAVAASTELTAGDGEISDARWFSRDELTAALASGEVQTSSTVSISSALIEEWYGQRLPAEVRSAL